MSGPTFHHLTPRDTTAPEAPAEGSEGQVHLTFPLVLGKGRGSRAGTTAGKRGMIGRRGDQKRSQVIRVVSWGGQELGSRGGRRCDRNTGRIGLKVSQVDPEGGVSSRRKKGQGGG